MRGKLSYLTCWLLICSAAWSQNKKDEFHTARLVKVTNLGAPVVPDSPSNVKASYLVTIQDGENRIKGYIKVSMLGHDRAKNLKADTDISYRISGNSLYLKTADGQEIKSSLCKTVRNLQKCGDLMTAADSPD